MLAVVRYLRSQDDHGATFIGQSLMAAYKAKVILSELGHAEGELLVYEQGDLRIEFDPTDGCTVYHQGERVVHTYRNYQWSGGAGSDATLWSVRLDAEFLLAVEKLRKKAR